MLGAVACAQLLGIEDASPTTTKSDAGTDEDGGEIPTPAPGACPPPGCVAERIVTSAVVEGWLTVAGTRLVWAEKPGLDDAEVRTCPLPGCTPVETVARAASYAVANDEVYFVERGGRDLLARPLGEGAERTVLASARPFTLFGASSSSIVFSSYAPPDAGDDGKLRVTSCAPSGAGGRRDLLELASDGVVLFAHASPAVFLVGSASNLRLCPPTGCAGVGGVVLEDVTPPFSVRGGSLVGGRHDTELIACETAGCAPRTIVTGTSAAAVAQNASDVYWLTRDGSLRRAPLSGAHPEGVTLRAGDDSRSDRAIALDEQHVYFTASDGIYRLPLP